MSDDNQTAWDDAHSLGIALRLAHAQNRELRKQLAASTSNGSLKFQDGICSDCESPDLCIQDNGCHNTGKVFSRIDHPSQQWQPIEKPEYVSDIHRPVVLWYPSHDAILYGAWDHCIEEWREWITDCPIVDNKPTHWMPLPAPPMSDK